MAKILMGITTVADKAVAAAGTRERLVAASTLVSNVTLQWDPANAGAIYIGDANVAAGRGLVLSSANPVANISVDDTEADEDQAVIDLYDIWIDAANNGDQVKIAYIVATSKSY